MSIRATDVVFTALFGGYESLNELSLMKNPTTRYVCFTDNPELVSSTWEIFIPQNLKSNDPIRMSREIKMLGHRFFPEATRSLYIDNTVHLKVDGGKVLDGVLGFGDVSFMQHSKCKSVRREFLNCSMYGLENQGKLRIQFLAYLENYSFILNEHPYWGGFIARKHTARADLFFNTWHEEYLKHSKRDQLSINISAYKSGIEINSIVGSNTHSDWHSWPVYSHRNEVSRSSLSGKRWKKLWVIWNAIAYGRVFFTKV